jgi:hypothetical protein
MQSNTIHSDQLYNWSANERLYCRFASSAPSLGQKTGPAPTSGPSWLSHRALQALRQSRLQMSARSGTRTQVLFIGQPSRQPTRDGLRPRTIPPPSLRLLAELPESPPGAGADLQHQPPVVTTSSEVLTSNAHGAFILIPARHRFGWDPRRQFFAELAASWLCLFTLTSNSGLRP